MRAEGEDLGRKTDVGKWRKEDWLAEAGIGIFHGLFPCLCLSVNWQYRGYVDVSRHRDTERQ